MGFSRKNEERKQRENQRKIRGYGYEELISLWKSVIEPRVEKNGMDGWLYHEAFEYLILRAFELEGAEVTYPFYVNSVLSNTILEELDGVIYYKNIYCISEAKCFRKGSNVRFDPIAKLNHQLGNRASVGIGSIFSKTSFDLKAKKQSTYIRKQPILLWDGNEIEEALFKKRFCHFLEQKFRAAFEHFIPDYNPRIDQLN